MAMRRRRSLEANGVKLVSPKEFQSFVTRIFKTGSRLSPGLAIRIPKDIERDMSLMSKDFLEVAIRKVKPTTLQEYGMQTVSVQAPIRLICPRCKKVGIIVRSFPDYISVKHGQRITHRISKSDPYYNTLINFYRQHRKLLTQRVQKLFFNSATGTL